MLNKEVQGFPNPFSSAEEKKDKKYGLAYSNAIWSQYSQQNIGNNSKRQRDIINRKYAEGLESIQKYKNRLDMNGDTSYLNLDFTPTNRIAMIVDNIVGKLVNQEYKVKCDAVDQVSKTQIDEDRKEVYANMFLKPISDTFEKMVGFPIIPKDKYIPESDEEAEIYFKINYKPAAAIAMEKAIDYVLWENDYKDISRRLIRDLVVLKKCAVQRYYDENKTIRVDYVDPIDVIVPYSKYDDFRNIPYQAIIRSYTIQEISQMTSEFTEDQLSEIAQTYAGKNNNPNWSPNWAISYEGYYANNWGIGGRPYDNFNISVLDFYFLTTNTDTYVKKNKNLSGFYFEKKKNPKKEDSRREIISKKLMYRYEGKWIIGSEYMWGYKMSENIEREKISGSYSPKTELPITMMFPNIYDMENKSLVERMIPHEDQINLIHLKTQQLLIKAKPPGVSIDLEGIENAVKGMGDGTLKPIDITKMYEQTGNFVFRSRYDSGQPINSSVITPLENGISRDFERLIGAYNHELQMINDVIGYNSAVDASSPDTKALVGVQKLAATATNNSLRVLFENYVSVTERLSKRVSLMVQDSLEYNNESFTMAIGKYATETLKYGKKIALNEFDIRIEFLPDEQERAEINGLIELGLQTQQLKTSDAIIIRDVLRRNVKFASQLLILKERQNDAQKQEQSMQLQQQNADVQQQSAQASQEGEAALDQQITQSKAEIMQMEYELKAKLSAQEHQQKLQEIQLMNLGKLDVAEATHDSNIQQTAFSNAISSSEPISA